MKKASILLAVVMLMFSALSIAPVGSGVAVAQNRHVFVEEFTGAWCGFCPRGAWALQQLEKKYPGQVIEVSYHGGNSSEPMRTNQGDSMVASKGFPNGSIPGFPDGWTAREVIGAKWDIDPALWVNPTIAFATAGGAVDTMVGKPAVATVAITNLSYNEGTNTVTATVSSTFKSAMSGDFRMNLILTEDSLTGDAGTEWDQTSYYYNSQGPFYQMGSDDGTGHVTISGWQHMHVFREAVGGVKGTAGVIANPTVPGTVYTKTYTFKLPSSIVDTNHLHLIAIVHQYSATDKTKNAVFDAYETDGFQLQAPKPEVTIELSSDQPKYLWAKAGGTTTFNLTLKNTSTTALSVKEDASVVSALPAGWTVSFNPTSVTLNQGDSKSVAVTVTAPQNQANFISGTITFKPTITEAIAIPVSYDFGMLSDNTKQMIYCPTGVLWDSATFIGAARSKSGSVTAHATLDNDVWHAFDASKFDLIAFVDASILDYADTTLAFPAVLPTINSMLAQGKKVMITSYLSGYNALFGSPMTATDAAYAFFSDTLGLQLQNGQYTSRNNGSNYTSFALNCVMTDVLATGLPSSLRANAAGAKLYMPYQDVFSTPAPNTSTPFMYSDGATDNVVAVKYQNGAGGRIVFYSMPLDVITIPKWADTLASHSFDWLNGILVDPQAAVGQTEQTAPEFTVGVNPFRGSTQISYRCAEGEHNVTFAAYDLLGRQIATLSPKVSGSNMTATFDAKTLPAGTYVIVKHSSTGSQELRVVSE